MSGERILIIDDSIFIVDQLAERILPTFGYETFVAYDGRSGLQLIREEQPDLIMMDLDLPDMTGLEIMQQMVQESIHIPVIFVTGYGSEQNAIAAFRLGARDYIIKPFTIDEITEAVARALVEPRLHDDKNKLAEEVRHVKVELSRQNQEMNTLFNIGKALTSLLSVDQVLERVLEASAYLTEAEESTIWMADAENGWLYPYQSQEQPIRHPKLSQDSSLVGQVMQNGRPLRQSDFHDAGLKIGDELYACAVLLVPLKLRGVTMGVLGVSNQTTNRSFSQRDEFLLSFLADYAAIALENAQVFQAADQALVASVAELNQLINITRTLTSSLDLDEVIDLTIQLVHDGWNIAASSIWLLDKKSQMLKVLANVGTASELLKQYKVPLGIGFVGYVTQTGKRMYTNDVASHPRHYRLLDELTGFKTQSLLCVPLISHGEIVGAMELLNKVGGFDDADVERAMSIGSAVAIAITNAQLYKEAETRKQHLETTLEHNTSPILITDAEDNLHLLNQVARTRLGLTNEAIGKPVLEVVEPPVLGVILTQPVNELKNLPLYERLTLSDGSVWVPRVALIPEHGRILILQDITALQELEEAKDLFVATVSHDMRSPLNAITGFAQNLGDMGPLNEDQELFVSHILSSTERMMNMVTGLLELAKVNTRWQQQKQPCNLGEVIKDVMQDFAGIALAKHIGLTFTMNDSLHLVEGDSTQLRSAISNLIDNAIKYSTANHHITIQARNQANNVLLSVQDEGIGIAAEQQPHIFEMFYRAAPGAATGVGLGLALVKSIAKSHQGQVWLESVLGEGSTFYLQLPAIAA